MIDWYCSAINLALKRSPISRSSAMDILDTETLEESYPFPWKKSPPEVRAMSGTAKSELAVAVGDNISKEQFESGMPKVFGALQKAWEKAHR